MMILVVFIFDVFEGNIGDDIFFISEKSAEDAVCSEEVNTSLPEGSFVYERFCVLKELNKSGSLRVDS